MGAATRGQVDRMQGRVLAWFDEHGRAFPWRSGRDPYRILVAEVMLQQTQTGRVAPIYEEFLKKFPTLEKLAHASAMDVIRAWKGLGYNRRAVELQRAAQKIVQDGKFPSDPAELRPLPGVGEYSANAIACFAFDEQVPVVDTNVRRVIARAALGVEPEKPDRRALQRAIERWLPEGEAYRWNQALMDVGAMLCRPESPLCKACPLKASCRYHAAGKHLRPRARPPAKPERFEGSRRQKRGGIIDALRAAAASGVTLAALARAIHPDARDRDHGWLVSLLEDLERDGLVRLSDGARRGSSRGTVRLPD